MSIYRFYTRLPLTRFETSTRLFSSTLTSFLKKNKGKKGAAAAESEEVEVIDTKKLMAEAKQKFDETLELHQKKINELRLGKSNPSIFDKLKIKIDGEDTPFTSIAQTTLKGGRFLNVTVFDPSHTKTITSAILASGLNMTPEVDKANPQLLKLPLPPPTSETKKATLQNLKKNLEDFKNHPHNKHCLANIRHYYLKTLLKKLDGPEIKKFEKDFETMRKKYADQLTAQYSNAEKALMK